MAAAKAADAQSPEVEVTEEVVAEEVTPQPAAEDDADKATSKPRVTQAKGHAVIGAAVVLRTKDGGERYLYRGAVIPPGIFTDDSVKHAVSVGLIEKSK